MKRLIQTLCAITVFFASLSACFGLGLPFFGEMKFHVIVPPTSTLKARLISQERWEIANQTCSGTVCDFTLKNLGGESYRMTVEIIHHNNTCTAVIDGFVRGKPKIIQQECSPGYHILNHGKALTYSDNGNSVDNTTLDDSEGAYSFEVRK